MTRCCTAISLTGDSLLAMKRAYQAITRDELAKFYDDYYRPNNSTFIVVGDVTMASIKPKLEKAFGDWKQGGVSPRRSLSKK